MRRRRAATPRRALRALSAMAASSCSAVVVYLPPRRLDTSAGPFTSHRHFPLALAIGGLGLSSHVQVEEPHLIGRTL